MGWVLFIAAGGIGVFAFVFGLATLLVYNDGRGAYAREYIRQYREERNVAVRAELAKLGATAAQQRRPTPDPRRPIAAVTAAPHDDTRWSVLSGRRS